VNVWLLNPYGPIPAEAWRPYRFAVLGSALARAGHTVTWWTSTFSHHFKRQRAEGWRDVAVEPRFAIRLVPTPGYRRNIGVGRIRRDLVFALRAYRRGRRSPAPDVIVTAESPLTFGYAGLRLGRALGCAVIHDQMDLWPEFFEQVLPAWLRPAAHAALGPLYAYRRCFYRQLDGLAALARPYLEAPLREAPVLRERPHALIYNGVDVTAFRAAMTAQGALPVDLPSKGSGEIWAVFAGSLGPSYDIPVILEAARRCAAANLPVRVILAGDGPARATVTAFIACHPDARVTYMRHMKPAHLVRLYLQCDIGLAAYTPKSNVEMPDKFYDYTAAGLPVINSLAGEVRGIVRDLRLGLQYAGGDPASLTDAIRRLVLDPALRTEMAARALKAAMEFDRHVQYKRYVELVEAVVTRHAKSRRTAQHSGAGQ
jgi:glycosyltransferase involved in cell wall biosynthesis